MAAMTSRAAPPDRTSDPEVAVLTGCAARDVIPNVGFLGAPDLPLGVGGSGSLLFGDAAIEVTRS
jgi:hypothetical protein